MKRPLSVTLIGILFIVAGTSGIVYHASEWRDLGEQPEAIWVFFVSLLAIVGGVFALRGSNIARWLLAVWMAYHVAISLYHEPMEVAIHVALLIVILLGLFNRKANAYFKSW